MCTASQMGGSVFLSFYHYNQQISTTQKKAAPHGTTLYQARHRERPDAYFISLLVNESGNTTHGLKVLASSKSIMAYDMMMTTSPF
jgi:hypothetical protein